MLLASACCSMDIFGFSLFGAFGKATPLVWALLPSIVGYVLYAVFKRSDKPERRTFAYIPLGVGLIMGIMAELQARDTLYMRVAGFGPTTRLIFHGILVIPIAVALAIFLIDRRGFSRVDSNL